MSDGELVGGIMKGILDFAVLIERFNRAVYHWAYALVGNAADAEEVTECVFVRVHDRLAQYDATKGSLCTWLYHISHNMAVSFLRQRNRRLPSLDAMGEDEAPMVAGPEELHDARERRTRLRRLVRDLEPKQRHALIGHFVRGLTWEEVAAEMDCCEHSARIWAFEAIEILKKEL
jgi:RNA polymerase sigma-70 factor (ECF subfamily)